MLSSNSPQILKNILFIFFIAFALSTQAPAKNKKQTELPLDNVSFSPNFILARENNEVLISVQLAEQYSHFPSTKLVLQQQKTLRNGHIIFKPAAKLHDDGKQGDTIAGDSIYTGKIKVQQKTVDNLFFRVESKNKNYKHKLISSVFTLPVKNSCGPTASLLPVNIFTPSSDKSNKQQIQFNIPGSEAEPRDTILRIVNGAQINASIKNRVTRAIFTLNNQRLLKLRKSSNIIEIPVTLKSGSNILEVDHLRGNSEQRVSVEIKACADQIILSPIDDTLIIDKDTLQSSATVTAQGVPVKDANVLFNISENLAVETQQTIPTADDGIANILAELSGSGEGQLSASILESSPLLTATVPVQAINEASIKLNQGFQRVTLTLGETKKLPYFLFYLLKNSTTQHLKFETTINAESVDIELTPPSIQTDNISVINPSSFTFEPTVKALSLGNYLLTTRATVLETGETFSAMTEINVIDQALPELLSINTPGLTPSAIPPATSGIVNIHASIEGTSTPPIKLLLDEVDSQGNIINAEIAELNDHGINGDTIPGDYLYSAEVSFNKANPQTILLRARALYFEQEIVSGVTSLLVTPFDTQSSPPDFNELIEDTTTNDKIFSNEILAKIIAGTHPDRIEQIAKSINGVILSVIPQLNLYRIQFTGDGSLQGVEQAISDISLFSEVINVSKNSIIELAGSICSLEDCPAIDPNGQWHLNKISAKQAWNAAKEIDSSNYAGSRSFPVAVIDFGLNCNHAGLSDACIPIDPGSEIHGTEVAGVIATSQTGNSQLGTTGVAWNTKVYSYVINSSFESLLNAITRAGNKNDVKIINLSVTKLLHPSFHSSEIQQIKEATCNGVKQGKLVVAAVGQPTTVDKDLYPAKLNDNSSYQCPGSTITLSSRILAVAASDRNDKRAQWSNNTLKSNDVPWIDIYAPGIEIKAFSRFNNGTSFAAPQVTAAAALLWPVMPENTSASEIHNRLLINADNIDAFSNGSTNKRLNICNAIPQPAAPIENRVTINFVIEDADFRNMFGVYDKTSREAKVLIDNVDLNSNPDVQGFQTTLVLTDEELSNLEFFLIPNGYSNATNLNYLQNTPANNRHLKVVKDQNSTIYRLRDETQGVTLNGTFAPAFFSENSLNSGNNVQVRGRAGDTSLDFYLDWEDTPFATSDQDYNDAIFRVTIEK